MTKLESNIPSKGDFVCDDTSESKDKSVNRVVVEAFNKSKVVSFPEKVMQSPLPSSTWVPFSHKSYLNPSGRTTYTNIESEK